MNRWRIPAELETRVLARDLACVYCGIDFSSPAFGRGSQPSWEHIINDASITTIENIARCCMSCNASKGARGLNAWLNSKYCARKSIDAHTVAQVVREALARRPPNKAPNPSIEATS